jgi:tRNA-specific 2-thiouridylase
MPNDEVDLTAYGFRKCNFDGKPPRVVVGLSGGVDSSVTAYILKWQGYEVIGLFMKNWDEQDNDGHCTAEADFFDVRRVCEKIGIPYYAVNFADEYMQRVFAEFLAGLRDGLTPNPDILCNREIKFGSFLQKAGELTADYIATGHYAGIVHADGKNILCKADDDAKDQSYFLCGLTQTQLTAVMFPLAHIRKTQVREIAEKLNLINAKKKDSTGICFIGERKIKQFLSTYIGNKKGEIRTLDGRVVGAHDGLAYYTIGQRKGMAIGGVDGKADTSRWFVVRKDIQNNILYVNNGDCPELYSKSLTVSNFNAIKDFHGEIKCTAKNRYRQPDQKCTAKKAGDKVIVRFDTPQRAVTLGQWCVLYDGVQVLGGGIISGVGQ